MTTKPNAVWDVLPASDYLCEIVDSDLLPADDGRGQYLWLEMTILYGDHKGGKLRHRLHIVNPDPDVQDAATAMLSAICRAVDAGRIREHEKLRNKPIIVHVTEHCGVNDIAGYVAKPKGVEYTAPKVLP